MMLRQILGLSQWQSVRHLLVLALLLAPVTRNARADDQGAAPAAVDETEDKATVAPKPPDSAAPAAPPTIEPAVGIVERLPSSAYPGALTRSLYGGSLWLSSQGVQWPYLPRTTIGVSGYVWLDTDYKKLTDGSPTHLDRKELAVQGRFVLRVTPTYSHGEWFVQGQAELVANKDQTLAQPASTDADDVWVRAGKWRKFDVTVGRFEAFEVYHLGMGLDINTFERGGANVGNSRPYDLYRASFLADRPGSTGNLAIHGYPGDKLRLELLTQVGNSGGLNTLGIRPAAIFDLGWWKLRGAAEYESQTAPNKGDPTKTNSRGFAGSTQFVFDPYVELGVNGGYALVDTYDNTGSLDAQNSYTERSFGGFLNARIVPNLLGGLGVNDARVTDQHFKAGRYGQFDHLQSFAALQYFWQSQLMIKLVVGYARANFDPTFTSTMSTPAFANKMVSGRLRFQYLF